MSRKCKPYGTYGAYFLDLPIIFGAHMDVQDTQDSLAKGMRIRNKKAKRRLHNKKTRKALERELQKELDNEF